MVHSKQVFHFNCVCYNEVPLYMVSASCSKNNGCFLVGSMVRYEIPRVICSVHKKLLSVSNSKNTTSRVWYLVFLVLHHLVSSLEFTSSFVL